jgi:prolyl 3-hydroxylase /prolyl 3,4-dihydroxylase
VRSLQDELFTSTAFRAWLAKVSSVLPLSYSAEARRFRPGLDYTLATSEEGEARLDVVLGLTPEIPIEVEGEDAKKSRKGQKMMANGWQSGEWGGWEVCAPFVGRIGTWTNDDLVTVLHGPT